MLQIFDFSRFVGIFSINIALLLVATMPVSADVLLDCGPPAGAGINPLFAQALEAKKRLEASTVAATLKRDLLDRFSPLQTKQLELKDKAMRRDADCTSLKAATDATLVKVQACQAKCNQAAANQSEYQACQACVGPVNEELALREAEFSTFKAKEDPYNKSVLDWEGHLRTFIFDINAAIPKAIQKEVDRMAAILSDSPAIFVVADSKVKANPKPKHYIEYFEQVTKNADHINEAARRHNVDPDLVRAVIWMESTRGYYDSATGLVLKPKTILPMNVYADYWTGFKVTREGLQYPAINIDTGTKILARIQARTQDGTTAKIATLYGNLGAQKVSEYGKTIEYYYKNKPWLKRINK